MRTTLSLDDDVLLAIREHAKGRRLSLGEAVSELARKGLAVQPRVETRGGFPIVVAEPGTPVITLERALDAEEDW